MINISIITTVYNTKVSYLIDLINSVKNQTQGVYEHIIVDDGSTSCDTLNVLKEYEKEPYVKVYYMEKNKGIGFCRNYGIDKATGDYVCIYDSDDWLNKDVIERFKLGVADCFSDMVVQSKYVIYNEKGDYVKQLPSVLDRDAEYYYFSLPTSTRIFRREFLIKNNIYFPNRQLYEDNTFFVLAACKAKSISYIDYAGYCNRQNTESFSHSERYKKAVYNQIPYDAFNSILGEVNNLDEMTTKYVVAQLVVMISTCSLVFCRETNNKEKKKIINENRRLIKKIKLPIIRYLGETIMLDSNIDNKMKQIIKWYVCCIYVGIDALYCNFIHKLMRLL